MDSNYPPEPMDDEGYPLKCKLAGVGGGIIAVIAILFVARMVRSIHTTKMTSMAKVIKAADFAAKKHRDQRRKGPDKAPYINHPIGVANILANEGGIDDPIVLQAALLHDTVEDTETSLDEIEQEFGKIVRDVVDEVTDQKDLPSKERKRLQVINAPKKSPRAKLVKLADKLHNLRQSPPADWTEERIQQYFVWSSYVLHGVKGTNEALETKIDEVLGARGVKMSPPPENYQGYDKSGETNLYA